MQETQTLVFSVFKYIKGSTAISRVKSYKQKKRKEIYSIIYTYIYTKNIYNLTVEKTSVNKRILIGLHLYCKVLEEYFNIQRNCF